MPICYFCGLEKKLRKAHIFPRKLYEPIRESSLNELPGDQVPMMYVVGTNRKPKPFQSGIYDSSILCRECDNNPIGFWDNYGQTLLLSPSNPENYISDPVAGFVYKIDSFDYKSLKLFFMSILWRAAITSNEFFSQVKLGCWEEKLRKMLLVQDPGSENDFSVILFKYEGDFSEMMSNVSKERQGRINFYRFRIPRYRFLIKVDKESFDSEFDRYILSPNQPLLIKVKKYTDSKEYEQMLKNKNKIPD